MVVRFTGHLSAAQRANPTLMAWIADRLAAERERNAVSSALKAAEEAQRTERSISMSNPVVVSEERSSDAEFLRIVDAPNERLVLVIRAGGKIEFGDGFTADEGSRKAAEIFAHHLGALLPVKE